MKALCEDVVKEVQMGQRICWKVCSDERKEANRKGPVCTEVFT